MNDFNFCLPLDVVKSTSTTDEWRIGGYASTASEDRQGDEILQKGLDISDFVNYGWFNFDHNAEIILGYPDKDRCEVNKKGFYVEGTLLKGIKQSQSIWETAMALHKSNSGRRLGFSVEGKVIKRNSQNQIVKAKIYNVAITPNPVNTDCTWDTIVKSFTQNMEDVTKSLEAGHGDANGSPLIPESLESAFKTLSYAIGDDDEARSNMEKLKSRLIKRSNITKSEAILYLQLVKGLSAAKAEDLYDQFMTNEED